MEKISDMNKLNNDYEEIAVLAGGCFWGMQDLFRKQSGVLSTRVGYTGGHKPEATYIDVKGGDTGHAEAIEVIFNSEETSFRNILLFFLLMKDKRT